MPATDPIRVCLTLTQAISRTRTVEEIYDAALDALADGLGVRRASVLLFDPDRVMRFKAWRALSDAYRAAVEGHTPWSPDTENAEPLTVPDVEADATLSAYVPVFRSEGIAAMAFIPLVSQRCVIGKFMLYYDAPHAFSPEEIALAGVIAAQVAFAVDRTRAEEAARRGAGRLRFALDAALMGTWDWDLAEDTVQWSDNLERIHGLPAGTFDGTFGSYEREIHPDDKEMVLASIRRALDDGVPHEVEYRMVAPDGTIRWVEGKGRVEYAVGRPARMTGVCVNVTRRKEAELARLEAAREASRLKDEFLATLSHELRTPLNAILGWTRMIKSGVTRPEELQQAIATIERNAALQAQLIEDILDVSRIITGKLDIQRAPVSIGPLIDHAIEGAEPAARARRIALDAEYSPGLPLVMGEATRLEQVLNNLLSNAVKFTPEGGRVRVAGRLEGEGLVIEVTDTGMGIDAAFLPFMFERFRQADSQDTRAHGGLGLGLAIAEHLVQQHGGCITAHSDGPGMGATFRIVLPTAPSAVTGSAPAADLPVLGSGAQV